MEIKIPIRDYFVEINAIIKSKWQKFYQEEIVGQMFRSISPKTTSKPWFYKETNRPFIQTICRLRSGHCLSPQYMNRFGFRHSPNCVCGEEGTLEHLILECPKREREREKLFNSLQKIKVPLPYNLGFLLTLGIEVFKIIYKYIVIYILVNLDYKSIVDLSN